MERTGDILKHPGFKNAIRNLKMADWMDEKDDDPKSPANIMRRLNLPSLDKTFDKFKKRAGTGAVLSAFETWAEGEGKPFLLCYGSYGNGKTHLLQAAILRLYERGIICRYHTFEDLLQRIKRGMQPDATYDADEITRKICRQDYLAIDDFGLGSETKWAEGRLDVIVDYRYRYHLPTVLVTNKDLSELPPRIVSRFYDPEISVMVVNEGGDYRRRRPGK